MPHYERLKRYKFSLLTDALEYASETPKEWIFYDNLGDPVSCHPYSQIRQDAVSTAEKLKSLKLKRYSVIGLVAQVGYDFPLYFYACQYAGYIPCALPSDYLPGGEEGYIAKLAAIIRKTGLKTLIGSEKNRLFLQKAAELVDQEKRCVLSFEEIQSFTAKQNIDPLRTDDPAYISFSSGSTAEPKGILLSQQAISTSVELTLKYGVEAISANRTVSWLPFYHTMGFTAQLLTSVAGISTCDFISPLSFIKNPAIWLKLLSQNDDPKTTFAPSFAWKLASEIPNPEHYNLSSLRVAGIGGDKIQLQDLEDFASTFKSSGFKKDSFFPCYGLSETIGGITFSKVGRGLSVRHDAREKKDIVSVGSPLPGVELIITDEQGKRLPDEEKGHIWIKSRELVANYYNSDVIDSKDHSANGFLETGDIGFLSGEQLFICGRSKDLIIVNGKNIWLQDIEQIAEKQTGKKKSTIAFIVEINCKEEVILFIADTICSDVEQEKYRKSIMKNILLHIGISVEIIFVPAKELPFTESGKPARSKARDLYTKMFSMNMESSHNEQ